MNQMIMIYIYIYFLIYIAPTVMFEQQIYSVDEDDGLAPPALILSNPSSTDITVQVFSTSVSATGEYYIDQWYIVKF